MTSVAIKNRIVYSRPQPLDTVQALSQHPLLHQAALDDDVAMIKQLVAAGRDPNEPNANNSTALHFAAARNNVDAIKILLSLGADPLAVNKAGLTPVEIGLFMGNVGSWYET